MTIPEIREHLRQLVKPLKLKRRKVKKSNWDPKNPHPTPWHMVPGELNEEQICASGKQLTDECHRISRDRGWWFNRSVNNDGDLALKLLLIVSEVIEAFIALRYGRLVATPRPATPEEVEKLGVAQILQEGMLEELADIEIRLRDLVGALGWSAVFDRIVLEKMNKNAKHDGSDHNKRF